MPWIKARKNSSDFDLSNDGELLNPAVYVGLDGNEEGMGVLDLSRTDREFLQYAEHMIWPYIKGYSFADRLKQAIMVIFGVPVEQLYGSDEQKNMPITIKWKDLEFLLSEEAKAEKSKIVVREDFSRSDSWDNYLTGRDIAQIFGSDVCRRIKNDCWVDACLQDILHEGYPFAVISDARFPNELDHMKKNGAKLVRLLRNPFDDKHISETALDNYPLQNYDLVIDNRDMTLKEKNQAMLKYLLSIGWVDSLPS